MSAPRAPTTAEWNDARAQALRVVRRNYSDVAHEADVIVDDAIAEALPRFTRGSFEALVTSIAKRRAIDRLRELEAAKEGYDELRGEAEEEQEATSPEYDKPEAPDIDAQLATVTLEQTREATLAECRRLLLAATGAAGQARLDAGALLAPASIAGLRDLGDLARSILASARKSPHLLALVDVEQLETLADLEVRREIRQGVRHVPYVDASGAAKVYGRSSSTEAAVLAILDESWPEVRAGDLPGDIIKRKAANIRQVAPK